MTTKKTAEIRKMVAEARARACDPGCSTAEQQAGVAQLAEAADDALALAESLAVRLRTQEEQAAGATPTPMGREHGSRR